MRKQNIYIADFETTVYDGQQRTDVWAAAIVELYSEDVVIHHSIGEHFGWMENLKKNIVVYYHNLKFDGSFILDWLLKEGYEQAAEGVERDEGGHVTKLTWIDQKKMKSGTFRYSISSLGAWYEIIFKTRKGYVIDIRDSLKLLPFAVKDIGEAFKTLHRKLEMEYKGFRFPGCEITPEEQQYIANDVLVVKEGMEVMQSEGHMKLTIGACCLAEYKVLLGKYLYDIYFPDLYEVPLDPAIYGASNADEYIRKGYGGGWCYVVEHMVNIIVYHGTTADVNSLYPSMMHSDSGNIYPIGKPTFWKGDIPPEARADKRGRKRFFYVRIRCRFYLKKNYLPFIQIKHTPLYNPIERLKTSDILGPDGKYHSSWTGLDGAVHPAEVELTMTMMDYELFLKHYDVVDLEVLDGCWFDAEIGIFDKYIDKYRKIKETSKGAKRSLAKLFLNNLYGKMASSRTSSFKVARRKQDGSLGFDTVYAEDKKAGYIAVGAAITSYARCFTITAAQANYHGPGTKGFIYADTDSIHCDLPPDEIVGIREHPTAFCCWKLESCWDEAIFVRPKTYIEHVTHEDRQPLDEPWYNVKCAGMPERAKDFFVCSMTGERPKKRTGEKYEPGELPEDIEEFLKKKRDLTDFKVGLSVPGKLLPKRIPGGVVLKDTTYVMR